MADPTDGRGEPTPAVRLLSRLLHDAARRRRRPVRNKTYFSSCPRDDRGHCKASGSAAAKAPDKDNPLGGATTSKADKTDYGHGPDRDITGAVKGRDHLSRARVVDKTTTHEGVKKELASKITPEQARDVLSYHSNMTMVGAGGGTPRNAALPPQTDPNVNMGPLERGALQKYSYLNDRVLNGHLRGKDTLKDAPYPEHFYGEMHDAMQSAFEKTPVLSKPVRVVRGMSIDDPKKLDEMIKGYQQAAAAGGEVGFAGYTSTATTGGLAQKIGLARDVDSIPKSFRGNVRMSIDAVHGIDMSPVSQLPGEKEFLLNHGSKFRVKSVKKTGDYWHVHLEQVPPARAAARNARSIPMSDDPKPAANAGGTDGPRYASLEEFYAAHPEAAGKFVDTDADHVTFEKPKSEKKPEEG